MHHCEFCDYKTIRKDNMQKHVDNMHEEEGEDYECEKCDFVTRRKGKMKTHMIKVGRCHIIQLSDLRICFNIESRCTTSLQRTTARSVRTWRASGPSCGGTSGRSTSKRRTDQG